jgi:hypothetical protein
VSQLSNSGQQWSDESCPLLCICVPLTKRLGGVCQCCGCAQCCAGMLQPSAGTAYIAGHDITTNMAAIRRSLGICPQVTPCSTVHCSTRDNLLAWPDT